MSRGKGLYFVGSPGEPKAVFFAALLFGVFASGAFTAASQS